VASSPAREPEARPAPADEPEPTPVRVRFALASHFERAELRHGDALFVDFGDLAGAKYTLGGWQTGVDPRARVEGTKAALFPGETGRILLPASSTAAATLHLSVRAFRDGRLTVYVNGDAVAHETVPTDGFGQVSVALDEGVLRPGDNVLQLRVRRRGRREDGSRAGLAIDWMRLGPAGDTPVTDAPAATASGSVKGLAIPSDWSVGYAFEVMDDARLRALVRGDDDGHLEVVAHRDGASPKTLARVQVGERVDIDLSEVAGDLVRLDLRAEGDISLLEPAVVTPAPDAVASAGEPTPPKNLVVYVVDTLRADKMSPWEQEERVHTPAFDRFVESAAVIDRPQAQAPWTKPSVATLLSGLMPWQHTATRDDSVLPRTVPILSELLHEKGYRTGAFIANGYVSGKFGFERGWDAYRNYIREGRRTPAEYVAADVTKWINRLDADEPFFLYVQTIDPHVPYIPPDEVLDRYFDEPYGGPVSFARDRLLLEKVKSGKVRLGETGKRRLEALHDAEITYHDEHFGKILKALDDKGVSDDTMIVFTSDHGEEFFDHGSVGHGHSVYQELLQVPLAVRIPGLTDGGHRLEGNAGVVDVLPTIFDAMGQKAPSEIAGRSLLPRLRGEVDDAPRVVVSGFHDGWRAAVVGDLKLVQRTWRHPSLFDLAGDAGEQEDVADARPLALRYLRGLLGLELARTDPHGDATEDEGRAQVAARSRRHPSSTERKGHRHEAQRTDIDPETEAQLEALGYVRGSRP
jgi:arylsulfatase A-like enzyme